MASIRQREWLDREGSLPAKAEALATRDKKGERRCGCEQLADLAGGRKNCSKLSTTSRTRRPSKNSVTALSGSLVPALEALNARAIVERTSDGSRVAEGRRIRRHRTFRLPGPTPEPWRSRVGSSLLRRARLA